MLQRSINFTIVCPINRSIIWSIKCHQVTSTHQKSKRTQNSWKETTFCHFLLEKISNTSCWLIFCTLVSALHQITCCAFPHSNTYCITTPQLRLLVFLPACLSASPSCPNLRLGERARCHADSGTQRCQGLAAAPNMISARPPCQPKKVKWNPCSLYNLASCDTSEPAARRGWWWVGAPWNGRHLVHCSCSDWPNQRQILQMLAVTLC